MKIVERQAGDVVVLDLHGKILIGEGDDALRDAVTLGEVTPETTSQRLLAALWLGKTRLIDNIAV